MQGEVMSTGNTGALSAVGAGRSGCRGGVLSMPSTELASSRAIPLRNRMAALAWSGSRRGSKARLAGCGSIPASLCGGSTPAALIGSSRMVRAVRSQREDLGRIPAATPPGWNTGAAGSSLLRVEAAGS